MKGRAVLAAVLTLVLLVAVGSVIFRETPPMNGPEPTPMPPTSGEELWWSLPAELLSDVAEGIMERISDLQDDLVRVQQIQATHLTPRPPPEDDQPME